MSFAADQEDDQPVSQIDANQGGVAQAAQAGSSEPDSTVSLGGGGAVSSPGGGNVGGGAQAQAAQQASKPSTSGSWTNLQDYMAANADQGAAVGSQIASNVSGQAQSAEDSVNQAASGFQSQVDQNTVQSNADQVKRALGDATSLKAGQALNQDDLTGFQSQYNANYAGPSDFTKFDGYGQAQEASSKAQQALQETGSEAGRDVLLQDQYKNASQNGYTRGEQNLDQLLLETSGRDALQPLQGQWSGLGSALSDATTRENAAAAGAASTDQATAAAARAALEGANTDFEGALNSQLQTANTNNAAAYQQALQDAKAGKLTPEEMQAFGLKAGDILMNTDLSNYLSQGSPETLYNAATADQYAEAQALAKLAGLSDSTFLPQEQAAQAGTAGSAYGFDSSRFNTDVGAANAHYSEAVNSANTSTAVQAAPMSGDWLASTGARTPWENISDLKNELSYWQSQPAGYSQEEINARVAPLNSAIAAYQQILDTYTPQRTLGSQTSQTVVKPKLGAAI